MCQLPVGRERHPGHGRHHPLSTACAGVLWSSRSTVMSGWLVAGLTILHTRGPGARRDRPPPVRWPGTGRL